MVDNLLVQLAFSSSPQVLDQLEEVKICRAYSINGQELPPSVMPSTIDEMDKVVPVYETLPGFVLSVAIALIA